MKLSGHQMVQWFQLLPERPRRLFFCAAGSDATQGTEDKALGNLKELHLTLAKAIAADHPADFSGLSQSGRIDVQLGPSKA